MSGKVEAFAHYGVVLKNDVWSWSGVAPNGEVVLSLWKDQFNYRSKPISWSNENDPSFSEWKDSLGNIERIENLKIARNKAGGRFRVVVISAIDMEEYPRSIKDAYPRPNMIMKLTNFDETTGKFGAELVGE
jgi:hypothetical protein